MNVRRINPDELRAAYEKIGATPKRGPYYDRDRKEGNGVGVYAVAVLGHPGGRVGMYRTAMAIAGFDREYVKGYDDGFDGLDAAPDLPAAYALGHADGRAGWDAVGGRAEGRRP